MIQEKAKEDRARKMIEIATKRQRYRDLLNEIDDMSCQCIISRRGRKRQTFKHSGTCWKCCLMSEAENLTIDVHEWPLPQDELQAKTAVFELDVPTTVTQWRDATYDMLVDVLSVARPLSSLYHSNRLYSLRDCEGLKRFITSRPGRVQLSSTSKPFVVAHYRYKKILHATEDTVCVNNGLRYAMYDSEKEK
jgi:hypothetical protein